MKFPPFIKRKQLADHIEKHGFGDNVISIEIHCMNVSNKKPAGSAKILITPFSLQEEFISVLNGSLLLGKHLLSVEPYQERKQRSTKEPPRKTSQTRREPAIKEPCVVFVGPILPNYINKGHIQAHFREYNNAITDIEFKGDRQRRGCHVLLKFKSSSSAATAIDRYNHTSLLGKHKLKLDFYKPHYPVSSSASCPTLPVSRGSAVPTPNTSSVSKQIPSTERAKVSNSSSSHQQGTRDEVASNVQHHSVGYHSTRQLSSRRPIECGFGETSTSTLGTAAAYYSDSEEDQLQNAIKTVIVKNLDSVVTQQEIERLTGVAITCYTPSHLTPDKVAAWIEVENSKCACTIAEKLNRKVVHGKELRCFVTDSHTLQQEMKSTFKNPAEENLLSAQPVPPSPLTDSDSPQHRVQSFPTFEDPHAPYEPLRSSQSAIPSSAESFTSGSLAIAMQHHTHSSPTFWDPPPGEQMPVPQPISDHVAQQEYLSLFFLGDQPPLQQLQPTFPQESTASAFIIPSDPQLPVHEPGPPVPATPL